jgi:hypothetical protein
VKITRTIQRGRARPGGGTEDRDAFLAKLAKYIPVEMTALFIFSSGIIESMSLSDIVYWGIFAFVVVVSPIYLLFAAARENKKPDMAQVVISPFAAIVWVFALGGPFTFFDWYNQGYGSLLLGLVTVIVPIADWAITEYLERGNRP